MKVLGIESTCDETAVAVVEDGVRILSNVVASQVDLHRDFGGVYPEMAAREHVEALFPTVDEALEQAGIRADALDLIGVAKGPGLVGPLMIGLNGAKALHMGWGIPFIGVDHVEAHLYAAMMAHNVFSFPAIGLVISGGHTFLVQIEEVGEYRLIGTTVDDAIGEAFDKVGAMLDLSYPGGPKVEELAKSGDREAYSFKAGQVKGRPWDFSFSGLKTNVLYAVKGQNGSKRGEVKLGKERFADVAASFQEAAFGAIAQKVGRAIDEFSPEALYVGGGVSANQRIRELLEDVCGPVPVYFPPMELCLDNGAMIAGLAHHLYRGVSDPLDLEPQARTITQTA